MHDSTTLDNCTNCALTFENGSEKYTVLKYVEVDGKFSDIPNVEALSFIFGIPPDTLNFKCGQAIFPEERTSISAQQTSVEQLHKQPNLELPFCHSCSCILSEMYIVHNQFNKKTGINSLISRVIRINLPAEIKLEDYSEEDFFQTEDIATSAVNMKLEEIHSAEVFSPPHIEEHEQNVETGYNRNKENETDRLPFIELRRSKYLNNYRCLSCNLIFNNYSEFKHHENTSVICNASTATSAISSELESMLSRINDTISKRQPVILPPVTRGRNLRKVSKNYKTFQSESNSENEEDFCPPFESDSESNEFSDNEISKNKSKSKRKHQSPNFKTKFDSGIGTEDIQTDKSSKIDKPKKKLGRKKKIKGADDLIVDPEWLQILEITEELPSVCSICNEGYNIISSLKEQESKIDKQERLTRYCFDCKLYFTNTTSYNEHSKCLHYGKYTPCQKSESEQENQKEIPNDDRSLLPNNNKLPFACKKCEISFDEYELLNDHYLNIHEFELLPPYESNAFSQLCQDANILFDKWCSVVKHISYCRQNLVKFKCKICNDTFNTLESYLCHQISKHGPVYPQRGKHICIICLKCYSSRQELLIHWNLTKNEYSTETGDLLPVTCPVCKSVVSNKNTLKSHMKIQHREELNLPPLERIACSFENCEKTFAFKKDLKTHWRNIHEGWRPMAKCKICSREFGHKSLTYHMRTVHLGLRPYKCSICDKSFASMSIRKHHEAVHRTERPFACEFCGKLFKLEWEMKQHADLTHRNKQMYICDLCGATIKRRQHFLTHMKDHEQKEKGLKSVCSECGKVYEKPSQLKRHMYMYHDEKNVRKLCTICGKKFLTTHHLNRHINSVHKKT